MKLTQVYRKVLNLAKPGPAEAPARLPDPALHRNCTELEVNKWVISEFVVNRLVPLVGMHPFPLDELMLMATAVCYFRPTHVFEWGTHIGKSARIFYEAGQTFSVPLQVHSADLPDEVGHVEHPGMSRGMLVRGLPGVQLHQGDGLDTALDVYRRAAGGGTRVLPLFFVDGDHSYQSVKRELTGILAAVPHAVVLLHDTFYQSEGAGYNVGPYRAIEEVLAGRPGYRVIATRNGLPGMTLVYASPTQ
jgi:hypothetical protein